MSFDAVVFDCDGVLVDSETPLVAIDQLMLADLGWKLTREELHARFVGHTADYFEAEVARHVGPLKPNWREPYRHLIDHALREDLVPIDGVRHVVTTLDVPVAVASNSSRKRVRESLAIVGLLQFFDGRIVSAEDVPHGKPAPDVYLRAADLLRIPPARCAAIEDSATGVNAARLAGMTVFGYADGLTSIDTLRTAGAVTFSSMAELPDLLRRTRT
jgi:HAD superfamily hydrolase (TIGR01509 family)